MNALDYFALIVVSASFIAGFMNGFLRVLLSLASTILGLILAGRLYPVGGKLIGLFTLSTTAQNLLGFILIFLIVLVIGHWLASLLRRGLKRAHLGWIDNVLGGAFGIVRGWLICSVVYLGLTAFPIRIAAVQEAAFSPLLLEGTRVLSYLTSKEMRDNFREGYIKITGRTG